MKKIIEKTTLASVIAILSVSCASTPKNTISVHPDETQNQIQTQETADEADDEKEIETVEIEAVTEEKIEEIEPEEIETEAEPQIKQSIFSFKDAYLQKISNLNIKIESSPNQTIKNQAFARPFTASVTDSSGNAAQGINITFMYPESKEGDIVTFSSFETETDSDGKVSFLPPVPSQSFDSVIKVFVTPGSDDAEENQAAQENAVTAPYKVRTNLLSSGGSISIVDFNQKGDAITTNSVSSSNLLMSLMQKGFSRIGNADFTSAIVRNDVNAVYKSAKSLLGNSSSFLIFGTVKYEQPIVQSENGYVCSLSGNIVCLNMRDGSILYQTTKTASVTERNEANCLPNARKSLATMLADAILYGM